MFKEQIAKLQKDIDDAKVSLAHLYKTDVPVQYKIKREEEIEELTNRLMFFERLG